MIDENKNYSFALLGGDRRQASVAKKLLAKGHSVKLFGLDSLSADISGAEICSTLEKAISGSEFVLLPLPVSKDKVNLELVDGNSPMLIKLTDIIELAVKHRCLGIIGGIIPKEVDGVADLYGIKTYDFYLDEKFQEMNLE